QVACPATQVEDHFAGLRRKQRHDVFAIFEDEGVLLIIQRGVPGIRGHRFLRGFFKPVRNLFCTSRFTRAANWSSCAARKARTASGSRFASSRNAHDSAFVTISSWSATTNWQTFIVRSVSPRPPRAWLLSATVLTTAARRCQRSFERARRAPYL